MGSGRGWLASNWPSTGGRSQHYCVGLGCGLPLMRSGNITRTQNVSEYMLVLALCLVVVYHYHVSSVASLCTCSMTLNLAHVYVTETDLAGRLRAAVDRQCWNTTKIRRFHVDL